MTTFTPHPSLGGGSPPRPSPSKKNPSPYRSPAKGPPPPPPSSSSSSSSSSSKQNQSNNPPPATSSQQHHRSPEAGGAGTPPVHQRRRLPMGACRFGVVILFSLLSFVAGAIYSNGGKGLPVIATRASLLALKFMDRDEADDPTGRRLTLVKSNPSGNGLPREKGALYTTDGTDLLHSSTTSTSKIDSSSSSSSSFGISSSGDTKEDVGNPGFPDKAEGMPLALTRLDEASLGLPLVEAGAALEVSRRGFSASSQGAASDKGLAGRAAAEGAAAEKGSVGRAAAEGAATEKGSGGGAAAEGAATEKDSGGGAASEGSEATSKADGGEREAEGGSMPEVATGVPEELKLEEGPQETAKSAADAKGDRAAEGQGEGQGQGQGSVGSLEASTETVEGATDGDATPAFSSSSSTSSSSSPSSLIVVLQGQVADRIQGLCLAQAFAATKKVALTAVWYPSSAAMHSTFSDLFDHPNEDQAVHLPHKLVPSWPHHVAPSSVAPFSVKVLLHERASQASADVAGTPQVASGTLPPRTTSRQASAAAFRVPSEVSSSSLPEASSGISSSSSSALSGFSRKGKRGFGRANRRVYLRAKAKRSSSSSDMGSTMRRRLLMVQAEEEVGRGQNSAGSVKVSGTEYRKALMYKRAKAKARMMAAKRQAARLAAAQQKRSGASQGGREQEGDSMTLHMFQVLGSDIANDWVSLSGAPKAWRLQDSASYKEKYIKCLHALAPSKHVGKRMKTQKFRNILPGLAVYMDEKPSPCAGCNRQESTTTCMARQVAAELLKHPDTLLHVAALEPSTAVTLSSAFHASRRPLVTTPTAGRLKRGCSAVHEIATEGAAMELKPRPAKTLLESLQRLEAWNAKPRLPQCAQLYVAELLTLGSCSSSLFLSSSSAAQFIHTRTLMTPEEKVSNLGLSPHALSNIRLAPARPPPAPFELTCACSSPAPVAPLSEYQYAPSIIIDDELKVVFCAVSEAADKEVLLLLRVLKERLLSSKGMRSPANASASPFKTLWPDFCGKGKENPEETELLGLQQLTRGDYLKFAFVRNPYSRILSTYESKHVLGGSKTLRPNVKTRATYTRKWFHRVFRAKYINTERPLKWWSQLSLAQFLELTSEVARRGLPMDPNLAPQTNICQLNSMKYDFVGHFESLEEDIGKVMKHLSTHHGLRRGVPEEVQEAVRLVESMPAAYNKYNRESFELAKSLYKEDTENFLNHIHYSTPAPLAKLESA